MSKLTFLLILTACSPRSDWPTNQEAFDALQPAACHWAERCFTTNYDACIAASSEPSAPTKRYVCPWSMVDDCVAEYNSQACPGVAVPSVCICQ